MLDRGPVPGQQWPVSPSDVRWLNTVRIWGPQASKPTRGQNRDPEGLGCLFVQVYVEFPIRLVRPFGKAIWDFPRGVVEFRSEVPDEIRGRIVFKGGVM